MDEYEDDNECMCEYCDYLRANRLGFGARTENKDGGSNIAKD